MLRLRLRLRNLYLTWITIQQLADFQYGPDQNKNKKHRMTHNNIQNKQLKIIKTG